MTRFAWLVAVLGACGGTGGDDDMQDDCTAAPDTPGSISGAASVCTGTSGTTYGVDPVSGASSYTWTVPDGATIVSGQGTESITVDLATASGEVTVVAHNSCGDSAAQRLPIATADTSWSRVGGFPVLGGGMGGPSGMAVDSLGHIYFADAGASHIARVDDMTGAGYVAYGATLEPGSGTGHFYNPVAVTIDAQDKIYVVDRANNRVVRIDDISGANNVSFGGPIAPADKALLSPEDVAVDASGRIYVADTYHSRIVRVDDMSGANWTNLGTLGAAVGQFAGPEGIAVGPDGKIYIADTGNKRIVRIDDMSGAGWTELHDATATPMIQPRSIRLVSGAFYFIEKGNGSIVRFTDMSGTGWTKLGSGSGGVTFAQPYGLAIDGAGKLYIAENAAQRVTRVDDMGGANRTVLSPYAATTQHFNGPSYVATDSQGRIYIADTYNARVVRIDDASGAGWTEWTDPYGVAIGIALDAQDRIYITHTCNLTRIDNLTGANVAIYSNGACGTDATHLYSPQGVTLDASGRIYIADMNNNRIVRIDDMAGTNRVSYGTQGMGTGQFYRPYAVAVDAAGKIYVADTINNRIVRIDDMTGAGWTTLAGSGAETLALPSDVSVAGGKLRIVDAGHARIVEADDISGAGWTSFGTLGFGERQLNGAVGMAVSATGAIHVTESRNHRLSTFAPCH